jgi:hypothetical protein
VCRFRLRIEIKITHPGFYNYMMYENFGSRIRWRKSRARVWCRSCCLFRITGDVWEVLRREVLGTNNVKISGNTFTVEGSSEMKKNLQSRRVELCYEDSHVTSGRGKSRMHVGHG